MISERRLAADFQGFWSEHLPLLTPSFVRLFNEAYSEKLTDKNGIIIDPIPIGPDIEHHDLVAELAFHLARISHEESKDIISITTDQTLRESVLNATLKLVEEYEGSRPVKEIVLNDAEWNEAMRLASNYRGFLSLPKHEGNIEFSPKISGAGFLGLCNADLSIGQTLYEIKTVNRNIAGKDIRQLILYLALQASTGDRKWINAGLFNPRRAIYYHFSVDHLMYRTSGGRSATEVFQDVVDFLSMRDFEMDTAF